VAGRPGQKLKVSEFIHPVLVVGLIEEMVDPRLQEIGGGSGQ
jgi:hypothetical protein